MTKEASRRASAEFHAKRKAEGWRKVTVWLSPEAVFKLDALKGAAGSADEAVRQALLGWAGPGGEAHKPPRGPAVRSMMDQARPGDGLRNSVSLPLGRPEEKAGARLKKGK